MLETLHIDLRALAERPLDRSGELPIDGHPWRDTGLSLTEPPVISFSARVTPGRGVQVEGDLRARVRLTCRRCLTESVERFVVPLSFILEPGLEPGSEDEGVFRLDPQGEVVDLGPIVREEMVLSVPEFPLCRRECRGLCPLCGIDLNDGGCECETSEPDPRWETLRKLRV